MLTIPVKLDFSPLLVDPALPRDSALSAIAQDVIQKNRLSLARALAGTMAERTADRAVAQFASTRKRAIRSRAQATANALLAAPEPLRAREFGRFAAVASSASELVASAKVAKLVVNPMQLQAAIKPKIHLKLDPAFVKDTTEGLALKKMSLIIRYVRCVEDTDDGFLGGSDEINLGGAFVDPFGNTTPVAQFSAADPGKPNDFDAGEVTHPNRTFATWNLVTNKGLPQVYTAIIGMAEKDDGGFYKFVNALYTQVEQDLKEALQKAGEVAVATIVGPEFAVIGKLIGTIVGQLVDWIIGLLEDSDDIFKARVVTMTLASFMRSYYDSFALTSQAGWTTELNYRGFAGHYQVGIGFRIF